MAKHLIFILLIYLNIANISCGVYGFRGNNPPPGINSIAIPTFQDISGFSDPTLAERLTQRLKAKIITDNTFRVADRNISDAVLVSTITNVRDEALVISSGEVVQKRKISVTVKVTFEDLKKQKKIWEKNFENYGEYGSSDISESERNSGLDFAIEKITEDILIDLTSNW